MKDKRQILVVARNCWGRGDTESAAIRQAARAGALSVREVKAHALVFDVPVGTGVDGLGRLVWVPIEEDGTEHAAPVETGRWLKGVRTDTPREN